MIEDAAESWPVVASQPLLKNWLITVRSDKVRLPDDHYAERTVVTHPGAVAILALDDAQRVLMIRQYRHPVGRLLWEIPAGLRDTDGESPLQTAQRELLEETGYRARSGTRCSTTSARRGTAPSGSGSSSPAASSRPRRTATSGSRKKSTSSPTGFRWQRRYGSRWRGNCTTGQLSLACSLGTLPVQKSFLDFAPRPRPIRRRAPPGRVANRGAYEDRRAAGSQEP